MCEPMMAKAKVEAKGDYIVCAQCGALYVLDEQTTCPVCGADLERQQQQEVES